MKYVQTMVPHVESNVDVKRFITRGDGGKLEGKFVVFDGAVREE
tara:strand:- start:300 stop:431 length:132 start_codon:yes stop_codon:yes gene_type:complete